jgi:hypothetical protein
MVTDGRTPTASSLTPTGRADSVKFEYMSSSASGYWEVVLLGQL